ncbi:hypothetical protein V8E51_007017 [Hyaloscypha variabilis]
MPSDLVIITGSAGQIGFKVLADTLKLERLSGSTLSSIPAVKGTVGILESVNKTTGIKRVVITGSITSITPAAALMNETDQVIDENTEAEPVPSPAHYAVAYWNSKIASYQATKDYIAKEKPAFDVITLMPTFVIGKNELVTDPRKITDGSNGLPFHQILGVDSPPAVGVTVHLDDVSKAHVLSLDPKVSGNTNYLLSSGAVDGII